MDRSQRSSHAVLGTGTASTFAEAVPLGFAIIGTGANTLVGWGKTGAGASCTAEGDADACDEPTASCAAAVPSVVP